MNHCPTALRSSNSRGPAGARRAHEALRAVASIPAAMVPLLPAACMAAYAGILSALGLGLLFAEQVLLPLVAVSIVLGVARIPWTIRAHGRKTPLLPAVARALLIASGRVGWSVSATMHVGAAPFLVAASWNVWLRLGVVRHEELAA